MLDAVRLNEAVLAHSGGHWLSPPAQLRWTPAHEAARDRLLRTDGVPALIKDPRTLLTLAFWRASSVPFRAIGIVRHPLAVARSLDSWRGTPLAEGVALWTAHNRALAAAGVPVLDFDQPRDVFVAAVAAALDVDEGRVSGAYEERLVHHDDGDAPDVPGLADAIALYRALGGVVRARVTFPRAALAAFEHHRGAEAVASARAALAQIDDAAAVMVPVVTALVRRRAYDDAQRLIVEHADRLDPGLAALLLGKVLLAAGDAGAAVPHLEAACAAPEPYFQARSLLPQALRAAGRTDDARAAMQPVLRDALYPHGPLAVLAEWSWLDGARADALATMARAIDAAPPHRRGRLRTRRAEWLLEREEPAAARGELLLAIEEDPGYARSREVLARIR